MGCVVGHAQPRALEVCEKVRVRSMRTYARRVWGGVPIRRRVQWQTQRARSRSRDAEDGAHSCRFGDTSMNTVTYDATGVTGCYSGTAAGRRIRQPAHRFQYKRWRARKGQYTWITTVSTSTVSTTSNEEGPYEQHVERHSSLSSEHS